MSRLNVVEKFVMVHEVMGTATLGIFLLWAFLASKRPGGPKASADKLKRLKSQKGHQDGVVVRIAG